jgi:hypothetical protein
MVFFELIEYDYLTVGFHSWYSKECNDTTVVVVGKTYQEMQRQIWNQNAAAAAYSNDGMDESVADKVVGIVVDADDKSRA